MKTLPPSRALAAKLVFAAFNVLKEAGGSLRSQELFAKLEGTLDLDEWARQPYAKSGYTRWVSILHFFSIDCVKAKFLEKERGLWKLTEAGSQAIKLGERGLLDAAVKAYREWKKENQPTLVQEQKTPEEVELDLQPPEELLERTFNRINGDLAGEILQRIKSCSPTFFERLVVELLVKMGYGGTRQDAGRAIGRSGDEGIDGVIHEDRLGLDVIYLQAKRWEAVVGRPEIQKFVGALQGQRAKKGVFITTSDFTKEAVEYVRNIDNKVVLINGTLLANLMIDHNVGVSLAATYEIKKIDSDYFLEE